MFRRKRMIDVLWAARRAEASAAENEARAVHALYPTPRTLASRVPDLAGRVWQDVERKHRELAERYDVGRDGE